MPLYIVCALYCCLDARKKKMYHQEPEGVEASTVPANEIQRERTAKIPLGQSKRMYAYNAVRGMSVCGFAGEKCPGFALNWYTFPRRSGRLAAWVRCVCQRPVLRCF